MKVTLPWPPTQLNPNNKLHWSKKYKKAKPYRVDCFYLAREAGLNHVPWDGPIYLYLDFYAPTRNKPDDDNIVAAFKAGRDGLADALGVDDKRFKCVPNVSDEIGGMVKVTISDKGPGQ